MQRLKQRNTFATSKLLLRLALLCLGLTAIGTSANTPEQEFLLKNATAMDSMMRGMSVKPSGDIDEDFVNMMEPHHQGAIVMAGLELRYGRNERLHRIAQEIIIDQQQEIAAMRLALGRKLPPSTPAPTQVSPLNPK